MNRQGRLDERSMREGLRIVAQLATRCRVGLLSEKSKRSTDVDQLLEELDGFIDCTNERERLYQPERARQEGAICTGEPVLAG